MNLPRRIVLAFCFAPVVLAQDLTLSELANRPEFLPSQVTLKQPVKLQGRPTLAAGQTLAVVSVGGTQVELETPDGRSTFSTKADDTDVLAKAQESWKKLTPEQRALTYAMLLKRNDLWPYRVTLKRVVHLSGGDLKAGESAILVGVEGKDLLLVNEKGKFLYHLEPAGTDLLESARKLVVNKAALPSRVREDLKGKLFNPLTGAVAAPVTGPEPKYYVFYRGAGWCGPCRQFSPALVKFDQAAKAKTPAYELVFISGDKTPAEMARYAKEAGFGWNAVPQARQPDMQIVNRLFTNLIPQLVVTDPSGNVIIDSAKVGTSGALKQFDALLKKG